MTAVNSDESGSLSSAAQAGSRIAARLGKMWLLPDISPTSKFGDCAGDSELHSLFVFES